MSPLQEAQVARAYAKAFPNHPPFARLPAERKREVAAYFESRGVIVNHRFGVTGRIGGYSALRRFTLGEQASETEKEEEEIDPEDFDTEPSKKLSGAERVIQDSLKALQTKWPEATDDSPEADAKRNKILDLAIELLMPIAKIAAKHHMPHDYEGQGPEDVAQDILVKWKSKVLRDIAKIQDGLGIPDPFVDPYRGEKGGERNLVADINKFAFNIAGNIRRDVKRRQELAPTTPIHSEHEEGEEGEPVGLEIPTGRTHALSGAEPGGPPETPETAITGPERTRDVMDMFRAISADLRKSPIYKREADLMDAILDSGSSRTSELATHLGWNRAMTARTKDILGQYLKRRAKTHPELHALIRGLRESAEHARLLCEKYPILHLVLDGAFIPPERECPMIAIYEKFNLV